MKLRIGIPTDEPARCNDPGYKKLDAVPIQNPIIKQY